MPTMVVSVAKTSDRVVNGPREGPQDEKWNRLANGPHQGQEDEEWSRLVNGPLEGEEETERAA